MKKTLSVAWPVVFFVAFFALPVGAADGPAEPAESVVDTVAGPPNCPGQSWRALRLHCKKDWSGVATGVYGGTAFSIACDGNRATDRICTDHGDHSYQFSMSSQSDSMAVDCAFSGNKVEVSETCGNVQFSLN